MFTFERLTVWQKAVQFANELYEISRCFPKEETFGMTNQLRRAGMSISLNIAEGAGRKSKKEFNHFISMSYGSVCEVITILRLCQQRSYINNECQRSLYQKGEEIARMLSGLSRQT